MSYLPVYIIIIALGASYLMDYTPLIISSLYLLFSLLTFTAYAKDKSAAKKGTWRVAEGTLHTLSIAGGWPGAILAQQLFRHKTKKTSFRIPFWITVFINSGTLAWLHTYSGAIYLNTFIFKAEELMLNEMGNNSARAVLLGLLSFRI